jgi:hypothetical protein
VEVGTYRGNYARMIYARLAESATLYCFDTFQGFPGSLVRVEAAVTGLQAVPGTFSETSLDIVSKSIVGKTDSKYLALREGKFPEPFRGWKNIFGDLFCWTPLSTCLSPDVAASFWTPSCKGRSTSPASPGGIKRSGG